MVSKVLFSVISGSDPWKNDHEGPILNIVREHKPDYVYLFCTRSIWENNGKNNTGRKNYDWEKYINAVAQKEVTLECYIEDVDSPHDFDAYKELFHKYIMEIKHKHPESELLLNVSSGTPQMQATLCLEYITYSDNTRCIQVSMPQNFANSHKNTHVDKKDTSGNVVISATSHDDEFCRVQLIEENSTENRVRDVSIISFKKTIIENQIRELISKHDYPAALTLINENKGLKFSNSKAVKSRLDCLRKAIQKYEILPEISEKYTDEETANALFHFVLLKLALDKNDIANVLIRAKSIAEYIIINHLLKLYPNVFYLDEDSIYRLNEENVIYDELLSYYQNNKYVKLGNFVNLNSCLTIITLRENEIVNSKEIINWLQMVNELTNNRNSVAHHLKKLTARKKILKNAVKSVQDLLLTVYPIDSKDLDIIEQYRQEILNYMSA